MKILLKPNITLTRVLFAVFVFISFTNEVFARGGGGGSGGGGGGGGGGSGGGGCVSGVACLIFNSLRILIPICIAIYAWYIHRKKIKTAEKLVKKAESLDSSWDEDTLKNKVKDTFLRFQKDWSDFNVENMKAYLADEFYKKIVLELNVLKSQNRRNQMDAVTVQNINLWNINDSTNNKDDFFTVEIKATALDCLIDTNTNKKLYTDPNDFTEYWDFVRDGNNWKLSAIKQATENKFLIENPVAVFAKRNNFFFDPDFGWLMMPNKGVIFRKSNFLRSDINNHVVGYLKNKIVEFYTFIPNAESSSPNYLVVQTTLPVKYNDILVRRKRWLWNFAPSGLRRIETESNDFNKKFCLYAHKNDQINSFVLLAPDFMEEVYNLPFELNIEIVDSFLYFYVKNRKNVDEDEMLRLLSKAFDSMKTG